MSGVRPVQGVLEMFAAGLGDRIDLPGRSAVLWYFPTIYEARRSEVCQGRVNGAVSGREEMPEQRFEILFQVIAAGFIKAQQADRPYTLM